MRFAGGGAPRVTPFLAVPKGYRVAARLVNGLVPGIIARMSLRPGLCVAVAKSPDPTAPAADTEEK